MARDTPRKLHITGIPATGKTCFARWLADEHDYKRCPSDEEPDLYTRIEVQIDRALAESENVVLDWGIPACPAG
jgi:hypothetical protein